MEDVVALSLRRSRVGSRNFGSSHLDPCLILELLKLTLRDLEMRKAELECAVTKRSAKALLSG